MIEINLLGDDKKTKKKARAASGGSSAKKLLGIVHPNVFISAILAGGISIYSSNLIDKRRADSIAQQTETNKQLEELRAKKKQLSTEFEQISNLEAEIAGLKSKINSVENVFSSRVYPVPKLDAISQTIPKFVWLTKLEYKIDGPKGAVVLEGAAITNDALSDFLAALQEYPGFVGVELSESIHQEEKDYAYKKFRIQFKTEETM